MSNILVGFSSNVLGKHIWANTNVMLCNTEHKQTPNKQDFQLKFMPIRVIVWL